VVVTLVGFSSVVGVLDIMLADAVGVLRERETKFGVLGYEGDGCFVVLP
jgi:hypothetical protein